MSNTEDNPFTIPDTEETVETDNLSDDHGKLKPRRKAMKPRSNIWDHFSKYTANGVGRCKCNYCGFSYKCNPNLNGTSTYRSHLKKCSSYIYNSCKNPGPKQTQLSFGSSVNEDGAKEVSIKNWAFDYEKCRNALAYMIIVDELPFRHVESQGFKFFCSQLQNRFVVPSRVTLARDCYQMFVDERLKLKSFLKTNCRRVCLTTDTWTSLQRINYMCLTAHFVDNDWKLNKRILNFCPVTSHKGEQIGKAIEKCLLAWGLEKVMTITVDNASSNDTAIAYLKKRVNSWGTSVLKGEYMHVRCIAHIMNLVVNDGLKLVGDSVSRVRSAVRYVRSSPARHERFKKCAIEEKVPCQGLLCLDVPTRWNSTFLMLDTALKFETAFDRYEEEDRYYEDELLDVHGYGKGLGKPIDTDWNHVKHLIKLLEAFYHLTLRVSGSLYVTCNSYFHEVTDVDCLLKEWGNNHNAEFKFMARKMKEKCDKYWGDPKKLNVMLFVAAALDPRYKLECVEYGIRQMYELEEVATVVCNQVKKALKDLFEEYKCSNSSSSSFPQSGNSGNDGANVDPVAQNKGIIRSRYRKLKATKEDGDGKSELDKYLDEECEPDVDDFDILQWWKSATTRFPILSLIARDVMAIPVSTVASESVFSTGGRVLDPFRSSLSPKVVEALICAQDWLRASPIDVEENVNDVEELEKDLSKISLAPAIIDIA